MSVTRLWQGIWLSSVNYQVYKRSVLLGTSFTLSMSTHRMWHHCSGTWTLLWCPMKFSIYTGSRVQTRCTLKFSFMLISKDSISFPLQAIKSGGPLVVEVCEFETNLVRRLNMPAVTSRVWPVDVTTIISKCTKELTEIVKLFVVCFFYKTTHSCVFTNHK